MPRPKGVGHFEANFGLKGYVSRHYLWTVRQGNGHTTTLPMKLFTQRNFVADFIGLMFAFIFLKQIIVFEPPFARDIGGNVRTPSIARWKAHGRLPILSQLNFFLVSLTVETL